MTRLIGLSALLVLGAALVVPTAGAEEKEKKKEKTPTISEIMTAAHAGGDSQINKAKEALKDKDFEALSVAAKKLSQLGTDLSKNKPPKGDAKNWKKLTSAYVANAKKLAKAADDKKGKAAESALKGLSSSCATCHKAHKLPSKDE